MARVRSYRQVEIGMNYELWNFEESDVDIERNESIFLHKLTEPPNIFQLIRSHHHPAASFSFALWLELTGFPSSEVALVEAAAGNRAVCRNTSTFACNLLAPNTRGTGTDTIDIGLTIRLNATVAPKVSTTLAFHQTNTGGVHIAWGGEGDGSKQS